jgi:hypothetical protein
MLMVPRTASDSLPGPKTLEQGVEDRFDDRVRKLVFRSSLKRRIGSSYR